MRTHPRIWMFVIPLIIYVVAVCYQSSPLVIMKNKWLAGFSHFGSAQLRIFNVLAIPRTRRSRLVLSYEKYWLPSGKAGCLDVQGFPHDLIATQYWRFSRASSICSWGYSNKIVLFKENSISVLPKATASSRTPSGKWFHNFCQKVTYIPCSSGVSYQLLLLLHVNGC